MIRTKEIKKPLEPPVGYLKDVITPWGSIERCRIVEMIALDNSKELYAYVQEPKTNHMVRWSTFKTTKECFLVDS
jgi:hypothetical protein